MLPLLVWFAVSMSSVASQDAPPRTRAERTAWQETSRNADVDAFLAGVATMPHGKKVSWQTFGHSVQGRPLRVAYVRSGSTSAAPRLRALVIANIHGGEVEGKEAVQMLLRAIAGGEYQDLLASVDLALVPVFNADGNDEIDRGNRFEQNGPDLGVGRRHNSQDRDLNRDFIKAESPEVRALLRLFATFDPHLFMDLHTTNGSYHGYHLTYCTSLNANCDPEIAALMHERFLPSVRQRMQTEHDYRIFDYGNFGRNGPESGWTTFSADPRLAINYVGLRHCLSLLSEAYSYLPFEDRAKVTLAFVLQSLTELVARKDEVLALRVAAEERAPTLPFRFAHELAPPVVGELLVGAVEEKTIDGLGKRLMVKPEFSVVQAPIQTRFVAKQEQTLPQAWAIVGTSPLVAQIVRAHGIGVWELTEAITLPVERFDVARVERLGRPFQGHRLVRLQGTHATEERALPAGTWIVRGGHPLARLAAQLLEANSDDGLATWGYFDDAIVPAVPGPSALGYPVLRLAALPPQRVLSEVAADDRAFPSLVPYTPLACARPTVTIEVAAAGTRVPPRGFEAELRFSGRTLRYSLGDAEFDALPALATAIAGHAGVIVARAPGVTHRELVRACEALRQAGVAEVLLAPDK